MEYVCYISDDAILHVPWHMAYTLLLFESYKINLRSHRTTSFRASRVSICRLSPIRRIRCFGLPIFDSPHLAPASNYGASPLLLFTSGKQLAKWQYRTPALECAFLVSSSSELATWQKIYEPPEDRASPTGDWRRFAFTRHGRSTRTVRQTKQQWPLGVFSLAAGAAPEKIQIRWRHLESVVTTHYIG